MSKKIKVYSSFKDSCLCLIPLVFAGVFIWSDYGMYVVEGKPLGFAFVLSVIFIAIALGLFLLFYCLFSSRMTIDGENIFILKWNIIAKRFQVQDITKLVLETRDGENFAITICVDNFKCKFTDIEKGYKEMRSYLLKTVSPSKCEYIDRTVKADEE